MSHLRDIHVAVLFWIATEWQLNTWAQSSLFPIWPSQDLIQLKAFLRMNDICLRIQSFSHITPPTTFHAVILAGEACKLSCEKEFELGIQSHFCALIRGTTHYCWDTSENVLSHLIAIHDILKSHIFICYLDPLKFKQAIGLANLLGCVSGSFSSMIYWQDK